MSMEQLVKSIYVNHVGTSGLTSILYPLLAGTDTEAAGTGLTAGGGARIYNPTVAAGFTSLITNGSETADYIVPCLYLDTLSALGCYFFRAGVGASTSEVIFERVKIHDITLAGLEPTVEFRTRRRVPAASNNRLSVSVASIAGGSETMNCHVPVLRGV